MLFQTKLSLNSLIPAIKPNCIKKTRHVFQCFCHSLLSSISNQLILNILIFQITNSCICLQYASVIFMHIFYAYSNHFNLSSMLHILLFQQFLIYCLILLVFFLPGILFCFLSCVFSTPCYFIRISNTFKNCLF